MLLMKPSHTCKVHHQSQHQQSASENTRTHVKMHDAEPQLYMMLQDARISAPRQPSRGRHLMPQQCGTDDQFIMLFCIIASFFSNKVFVMRDLARARRRKTLVPSTLKFTKWNSSLSISKVFLSAYRIPMMNFVNVSVPSQFYWCRGFMQCRTF